MTLAGMTGKKERWLWNGIGPGQTGIHEDKVKRTEVSGHLQASNFVNVNDLQKSAHFHGGRQDPGPGLQEAGGGGLGDTKEDWLHCSHTPTRWADAPVTTCVNCNCSWCYTHLSLTTHNTAASLLPSLLYVELSGGQPQPGAVTGRGFWETTENHNSQKARNLNSHKALGLNNLFPIFEWPEVSETLQEPTARGLCDVHNHGVCYSSIKPGRLVSQIQLLSGLSQTHLYPSWINSSLIHFQFSAALTLASYTCTPSE